MNSLITMLIAVNTTAVNALNTPESVLSWQYLYAQSLQLLHATAQILPTLLLGFTLLTDYVVRC